VKQHRPLSEHEQAIIERLLSVDFPEADYFRRQVRAVTVTGTCGCGCGSISLSVGREAARAPSEAWDWEWSSPMLEGDADHWLMLVQRDGVLTELEHVNHGEDGPDLSVIDAETIEPELMIDVDEFG
jgi:hypothetical protein